MTVKTLSSRPRLAGAILATLILVVVGGWWLHSRHFETTDDAQVEGHLHAISSRTTGTVAKIPADIQNNRYVDAGTLLVELDTADQEVALDQAKAKLRSKEAEAVAAASRVPIVQAAAFGGLDEARAGQSEAEETVALEQANLVAAEHRVELAEIVSARAERDRARYLALVEKHEISKSEYDARDAEARAAVETIETDRANAVAAKQRVAQARSRVQQRAADLTSARTAPNQLSDARARALTAAADVEQARAEVRIAELNLSYTKIYAPVGGIIGRKTVETGHRIQPGQTLLMIVPVDDLWITANFKEMQLRTMRSGQRVEIHVDAFDRDVSGVVEDLPGAAGTLFSLLPPENASGNYVKVVQRLPVRIRWTLDQDPLHQLRPGMSVEARVRVY